MDRQARHNLRQPIATMSMIATTLAQFGEGVDEETKSAYRAQVEVELERLNELLGKYGVVIAVDELTGAVRKFLERVDDPDRGLELEKQCSAVLLELSRRGMAKN